MPQDIVEKFSSHLKNVLTRALCFVVETNQQTIQPEHLLWALGTQRGCIGAEILKKVGLKSVDLRKLIGAVQTVTPGVNVSDNLTLHLSDDAKRIVEKAVLSANIYGHKYVGTEHLLSGIVQIKNPIIETFLNKRNVDQKEIRQQLSIVLKSTSKFPDLASNINQESSLLNQPKEQAATVANEGPENKVAALEFFGRELTSKEIQKKIDPVIGRELEIERLMQVLCRRTKNNPLLLGEPGVGKTAIVEGLAKKILHGQIPPALQNKRIFAIDMALVIAGTMYRGEFEGRLRQIIDEVTANPDILLFIDELHTIVGAGAASGSMDAANMLKPALSRGDIRCIGATTTAEYKKHIESDSALERRFQSVHVEEPSEEKTIEILQGIAPYYEKFHGVHITPHAIDQAVKLSVRYIQDKHLPDKAIDLLDEASAATRVHAAEPGPIEKRKLLENKLENVRDTKRQAVVEERFLDAIKLKEEEEEMSASLLINRLDSNLPVPKITGKEISEVISKATGIPLTDILEEDKERLRGIENQLRQHVIGQDEVLGDVGGALRRAKTGIAHQARPLASFMFLGPSGVGKTELAKAVAETIFHGKKNLIRLDMSEYSEGFTMSKLIGAPAGYVGYKEQANLTDRIKQRPYSVILFDEIEKAHTDVQNLLLQILEEGDLTDATGRKVNFKNTIIVMTSNVGLERFERGSMGFIEGESAKTIELNQDLRKELEERFRPEMLNRIDHVCVFQPLSQKTLEQICNKQMKELVNRMQFKGINLAVQKQIMPFIAKLADTRYGARNIRQHIQSHVETKIAERLTKKDNPDKLSVTLKGGKVVVTKPQTRTK